MDLHELLLYLSRVIYPAKTTGIFNLIGIGLGVGLTAYILYKFSHKGKDDGNDEDSDEEANLESLSIATTPTHEPSCAGLNHLTMGNGLTAGIELDNVSIDQNGASNVRHRSTTRTDVSASIVEDVSGAYISRTFFSNTNKSSLVMPAKTSSGDQCITESCSQIGSASRLPLLVSVTEPTCSAQTVDSIAMCDSGYLEAADHKYSKDTLVNELESSEISSLSDQYIRDLGLDTTLSDFSSNGSSHQQDDADDDVLRIEINEDDLVESEAVAILNSILDGENTEYLTDNTITTDTDSLQSHLADQTHCSNIDLTDHHSMSSNFSPTISARKEDDSSGSSRPSSLFSSPLFENVSVSGHSRSSSTASADIDWEPVTADEDETHGNLRTMELELEDIRQEMNEIEEKLNDMMEVDTTKLYFNVDSMKKLMEVVLSSEDVNLTSNEIAKAFQILRKYRYTFTSPARKHLLGQGEADAETAPQMPTKSLPYLDLADSRTPKSKKDDTTNPSAMSLSDTLEIVHAYDLCDLHPYSCPGYSKIVKEHGFTKMYAVGTTNHPPNIAAYVGHIIQHGQCEDEISIDSIYKKLEDIQATSSFLEEWKFSSVLLQSSADKLSTMKLCVKTCIEQSKKLRSISDPNEKAARAMHIFNHTASSRALILEGIRLQVFLRVNELYREYIAGGEMPLHAWLLFTRDTSTSPRCYFINHIQDNSKSELNHIELSLVADALRISLRLFRPMETETANPEYYPQEMTARPCVSIAYHNASSYAVLL
ncbi:uncharacterized protein [Watersipora subatra]|uniref:uncharacterized protein isoform X2 n=1 Tax=Watersipora subatra TaxID=2589382 RepID=UPI00355ADA40